VEREEKELDSYLEEGTEKRVREGKGIRLVQAPSIYASYQGITR